MTRAKSPEERDAALLTLDEAGRRLGIGRTSVYQLLARNRLDSVRIGRSRRIPAESVDAYVASLRAEQEGDYLSGSR